MLVSLGKARPSRAPTPYPRPTPFSRLLVAAYEQDVLRRSTLALEQRMLWLAKALQTTGRRVLEEPCRAYATRIGNLGKLPAKVDLPGVKAAVAVASGKGGVGKSTTTGAPWGPKQAKWSIYLPVHDSQNCECAANIAVALAKDSNLKIGGPRC